MQQSKTLFISHSLGCLANLSPKLHGNVGFSGQVKQQETEGTQRKTNDSLQGAGLWYISP